MIEITGITHDYGARRALDDVSLTVRDGEIFGLLGPNGGGKTTLFRILSTLMRPTAGSARVMGHDTVSDADAVRRCLGVVFQNPSLDKKLTVAENLKHQARLYGVSDIARRSAEMLERLGLSDRAGDRAEDLSGGLRRRAELAKGLLHEPQVLIMDEPSTGLDPGARRDLWTYLRQIPVTSLVTTHLMEEAEKCDRLAILDEGKLVALGTPDELRAEIGGDVITLTTSNVAAARAALEGLGVAATETIVVENTLRFERSDGASFIPQLVGAVGDLESVSLGKPTLEDVFIKKTGHRFWA